MEWICGRCFVQLVGEEAGLCPTCGGSDIVPVASPRGAQLVAMAVPAAPVAIQPGHVVCANCVAVGRPGRTGASSGAQLILALLSIGVFLLVSWIVGLLLFVVLLVYTAAAPSRRTCRACGSHDVVPGDSPRAQELIAGRR